MLKKLFKGLFLLLTTMVILPMVFLFFMPTRIISKEVARVKLSLPTSHFMFWRGAEVHYLDEGHGPVVLMIHGYGGSARNFEQLTDSLKDSYRVISVDLPGFGLSDMPAMGLQPDYLQMYRDYISFVLDTLQLHDVCVMGNSMGGGIGWLSAGDHPDKITHLVLLGSAGYDPQKIAANLTMVRFKSLGRLLSKGMPEFVTKNRSYRIYANPEKVDASVWTLNNEMLNRQGNIESMLALAWAQQFPDTLLIKRIQCPSLIVWGKEDNVIPCEHAERFHRDILHSQVIIYDSCGHVPMMECPGRLKSDFLRFVTGS